MILYQKLINIAFKKITLGLIKLQYKDQIWIYGDQNSRLIGTIDVKSKSFFKRIALSGEIGLGESYVDMEWRSNIIRNKNKIIAPYDEKHFLAYDYIWCFLAACFNSGISGLVQFVFEKINIGEDYLIQDPRS